MADLLEHVWPLMAEGKVVPVVDRVLPITQAERAHDLLASNGTVGKVLLTW